MKKYDIPEIEIKIAMQKGALNMLTMIEHDKIEIPYAQSLLKPT